MKTVFVVDDSMVNLKTADDVLSEHYNVLTISSAEKMFKLIESVKPDLILLDIEMPKMNGLDALEKLKSMKTYADIPVIFLTGRDDDAAEIRGFELGAADFISKPFSEHILLNRVKNHLNINFGNILSALDRQIQQQDLMLSISRAFLSDEDINVTKTNVFRDIGEFLGLAQILMFVIEDDGVKFSCTNEWIEPSLGMTARIGDEFKLVDDLKWLLTKQKHSDVVILNSDDFDTREALSSYRFDFPQYLVTTVYIGEKLHAVLDFSKQDDAKWDQNTIDMITLFTNIMASVIYRQSTELQLIAAKELAERSSRSKGAFLAGMSHEIRTPMNAILGVAEIQMQNPNLAPDVREAVNIIYDSGSMLVKILNDILDFSKIDAGKMEIVPIIYDIASLITDIVQLMLVRYEDKQIAFEIDLDENTPFYMLGDELRIKQILNNLLSNAFKYTDKGKIVLSVSAESGTDEMNVTLVLKVSDTGQGLSKKQLSRIFEEYSRFNIHANRDIVGTGLGMSITKNLVDMMGGEITVESEQAVGSTFTVRLPQEFVDSFECGAELVEKMKRLRFDSTPKDKRAQISYEHMPYGKVLIVDDVHSNLFVAKGLMQPYGLNIETAESGVNAVEKIKNGNTYDIVFIDHMMPHMDGMEATKLIRGMGYQSPIVALTANAAAGQAEMFLENGFDGFLSKPIDTRELNALINLMIRDRQPNEVIEAARREQAEKETAAPAPVAANILLTGEMAEMFVIDAENTVAAMENICAKQLDADDKDKKLYTTAVHGIKNALAIIDETELSEAAGRLESAGQEWNWEIIKTETPPVIAALKSVTEKLKQLRVSDDAGIALTDSDLSFLHEKLLIIKNACAEFDRKTAKAALNELKNKQWSRDIKDMLDTIASYLILSEFAEAMEVVEQFLKICGSEKLI